MTAVRPLVTSARSVSAAAAVYVLLLGYRPDYLGHFLAGYGGTLLLLAFAALGEHELDREVVGATVVAILLGIGAEATVFRIAIFDPVDVANQSLGACLAAAGMLGRTGSGRLAGGAMVLATVALVVGFRGAVA